MNLLRLAPTQSNRNIGIELARIISMLMVLILHIIRHGGVLKNTIDLSINNNILYLLNIACYGAVNIYALINRICLYKIKT